MARAPDQRAIEAKELYDKGLKLIEIAKELDVPVGTVRSWKNRQCWDNATLQKKKRNVAKKRGGQPGNKNAKGHGGTGPPGNKNAVKTGEFETLFFDTLNPEELQLAETIGLDKEQLLLQEIQLLTVREYRMLHRIEALKNAETQQNEDEKPPPGMTVVKYTDGLEKGDCTELKEYAGILGQIQQIEDALTRVQAKKQKAIEAIHKFGYDDAKLELATMQLELQIMKQDGGSHETADDGFMDAMNATDQQAGRVLKTYTYMTSHLRKQNPWYWNWGHCDLRKEGSKLTFFYNGSYPNFNIPEIADMKCAKIQIAIKQRGTRSGNKYLTYNGINAFYFQKLHVKKWRDVPNKFAQDCSLIANCSDGSIRMNGLPKPDLGALGNDWETFCLKPGVNQVQCLCSSWAKKPTFKMKYREVFL